MTKPRRHLAGQVVMLTRRTIGRQYLLRPDKYINDVIAFEIGRAAERNGQDVHGVMCMSNHPHIIVTDTTADRSGFMRDTMSGIARARNCDLNRYGYFWDARPYGDTVLLNRDCIEEKLIYSWVNPVLAGLVKRAEDWPGFKILPKHWGETIEVKCPDLYYGKDSPKTVKITPQPPPGYEDMSLEEVKTHFQDLLRKKEDEILEQHADRRFKGATAVQAVNPFSAPNTPAPMGGLSPRFATKDAALMTKAKARYREFLDQYEKRRQRWLLGIKGVKFPCGTVQMKRWAPITCEPPDPDEPGLVGCSKS